MIVVNG
ncbi:hypothetical protein D049_3281A, partial [Vibrio parahaemolyticus VPTS-2010]